LALTTGFLTKAESVLAIFTFVLSAVEVVVVVGTVFRRQLYSNTRIEKKIIVVLDFITPVIQKCYQK
jgi:hypothetical protein